MHAERVSRLKRAVIDSAIEKLVKLQTVHVDVTCTLRDLHANVSLQDKTNKTDKTKQDKTDTTKLNSANADSFPEIFDPAIESWFNKLKPELIESWIVTYQDKSWIKQELLKISTWCIANASKAPKSNYARFVTNWLARGFESYRKTIPSQPMSKAEIRDQHNINAALEAAEILRKRNEQRRKSNQ